MTPWAKMPAFEAIREKELARIDEQIAQRETKIPAECQPQPHGFVLKPGTN